MEALAEVADQPPAHSMEHCARNSFSLKPTTVKTKAKKSSSQGPARGGLGHPRAQCARPLKNGSLLLPHGYIAQWLERLTADQQVPGSNPGVPSSLMRGEERLLTRSRSPATNTRGGTRTRNLLLRREAPYPLGHTSTCASRQP